MLLGEIEDLKQQLQDLEEEREFSKHEWEGILAAEQEKNEALQKQLASASDNSQVYFQKIFFLDFNSQIQAGLDDIKSLCEELKAKLEVKSAAVEQLESELHNEKELRQTTELEKEELNVKIQELDGNIDNLKSTIQSSAEGQSEEVTQTLAQL